MRIYGKLLGLVPVVLISTNLFATGFSPWIVKDYGEYIENRNFEDLKSCVEFALAETKVAIVKLAKLIQTQGVIEVGCLTNELGRHLPRILQGEDYKGAYQFCLEARKNKLLIPQVLEKIDLEYKTFLETLNKM